MGVFDDDPEPARADHPEVEGPDEIGYVSLDGAGRRRDLPHLVVGGTPKFLAQEVLLHLLHELGRGLHPGWLEELDLEDLGIRGAGTDVDSGPDPLVLEEMAGDGRRHDVQIGGVDARGDNTREHGPLEEPAGRCGGAAQHHSLALLQSCS